MKAHLIRGFVIAAVGWPVLASAQPTVALPKADGWASVGWQIVNDLDTSTLGSYDEQRVIGRRARASIGRRGSKPSSTPRPAAAPASTSSNRCRSTASPASDTRRCACGRRALPPRRPTSSSRTRGSHHMSVAVSKSAASRGKSTVQAFSLAGPTGPRIPERSESLTPGSDVIVRPLVAVGFKAYLSRRAFFRTDSRLTLEPRVQHVLIRFGFGVDF